MISKGKLEHLKNLYRPDGFFWRGNILCFKEGDYIYINLTPVSEEQIHSDSSPLNVVTLPCDSRVTGYDINFAEVKGANRCQDLIEAKKIIPDGKAGIARYV